MGEKENHKLFLEHLGISKKGVWSVASWLNESGYPVKINISPKSIKHNDWKKYADQGDLEVSLRIEVKQLGINFSSEKDWPFGDKFIVCAKHSFDNAVPKPFAYIILSKNGEYGAAIKSSTRKSWHIEEREDSRYHNIRQEFYFCPLNKIKFIPLEETLIL